MPLKAISIFADPSVNFALQFQPIGETDDEDDDGPVGGPGGGGEGKKKKSPKDGTGVSKTGEVISLDQFRKK